MKLRVLWIDDEYKKLEDGFGMDAVRAGIELMPFVTSKEGMDALEKDFNKYDAVILDAKGFDEDENESLEFTGLLSSLKKMEKLCERNNRHIYCCIYTGQPNLLEDSVLRSLFKNEQIFDKNKDEDVDLMFGDIKKAAENDETTQLKHRYADVLKICEEKYLGEEQFGRLIGIIKEFERTDNKQQTQFFTDVRKVIERLFDRLCSIGIIPEELKKNTNGASKFLAGEDTDNYYYAKPWVVHPSIRVILKPLINIVQDASHDKEDLYLKADEFVREQSTGYLFKSIAAELFELLVYMKNFIDTHQSQEENKSLYTLKEPNVVSGVIVELNEEGFAFLKLGGNQPNIYIHRDLVNQHKLNNGDKIVRAIKNEFPDKKTGEPRVQIKKIEEIVKIVSK